MKLLGPQRLAAFVAGDVYIDFPQEEVKFRFEKATRKVYRRFYSQTEVEIEQSSNLYQEAISVGEFITRDEYFRPEKSK